MPARSDDPLRRVTLNLYEADCTTMERIHGHGWTEVVRNLVKDHCRNHWHHPTPARRTLGDLE